MAQALFPATTALLEVLREHEGRLFVDEHALTHFLQTFDVALQGPDAALVFAQVANGMGMLSTKVKDVEILRPLFEGADRLVTPNLERLRKLGQTVGGPTEGFDGQMKDFAKVLAPTSTVKTEEPAGPTIPFKRPTNVQG